MKSRSYDLIKNISKSEKLNKTESFAYLYNASTEKFKLSEDSNVDDGDILDFPVINTPNKTNKKRKSKCQGNNSNCLNETLPNHDFSLTTKTTSTPISSCTNTEETLAVKSIMKRNKIKKVPISLENTPEVSKKKRNKSVSFIVDENEEIADKKLKTTDVVEPSIQNEVDSIIYKKKNSKKEPCKKNDKEGNLKENVKTLVVDKNNEENKKKTKINKKQHILQEDITHNTQETNENISKKSKKNRSKIENVDVGATGVYNILKTENDDTFNKKKEKSSHKHKTINNATSEGEPDPKNRKKNITKDLEKLTIGDNAYSLTGLIDEMSVVDKNKKKKSKKVSKKLSSDSLQENEALENIEEAKEKVKWTKRKWNKDKKGEITDDDLLTSVIVENLPLKIMTTYRKLLTEHFNQYGQVKKIGAAELYPSEETITSFATTVYFMNEESTTKALEADQSEFCDVVLRVKRPLPATQTTLVVRSHASLDQKAICAAFVGCGTIRHIRPILKGKKSMSTVFVEFDGPESAEKARKMTEDAKIGGKKIFVSKFMVRGRKEVTKKDGDQPTA